MAQLDIKTAFLYGKPSNTTLVSIFTAKRRRF
jgi:hypothetical protein